MKTYPTLNEVFPFDYVGGGYFRLKGVPKGTPAKIIHGQEAIQFLYDNIKNHIDESIGKVDLPHLEKLLKMHD